MLNKNAKKWVKALRSGKYLQGKKKLCKITNGKKRYCCLGVACELYQKEIGGLDIDKFDNVVDYNRCSAFPPEEVVEWLGLKEDCGEYFRGKNRYSLSKLNDFAKYNFKKIADVIESEPDGLFTN